MILSEPSCKTLHIMNSAEVGHKDEALIGKSCSSELHIVQAMPERLHRRLRNVFPEINLKVHCSMSKGITSEVSVLSVRRVQIRAPPLVLGDQIKTSTLNHDHLAHLFCQAVAKLDSCFKRTFLLC